MEKYQEKHYVKQMPSALSPAAKQRLQRFHIDYRQSLSDRLQSVALAIMVWGPGVDVDSPIAKKRWEIRDKLQENGHAPLFSEELDDEDDLTDLIKSGEGFLLKALHRAQNADFLVLLLDKHTTGVITELNICIRSDIAAKVFVMAPVSFQNTFIHKGAIKMIEGGNGAVYWYSDDDIEICNVLTAAIDRVEQRRLQFALEQVGVSL